MAILPWNMPKIKWTYLRLHTTHALFCNKILSLTFALSGIIKELVIMVVSQVSGEQELTLLNWTGFAICVSGIAFHTFFKFRSVAESVKVSAHSEDSTPLIEAAGDSNDEETIYDAKL